VHALVIHAHPSPTSFCAALARETADALAEGGATVDFCDLYAENFNPVLPPQTFRHYLDAPANRAGVERHVERLLAADILAFVFPVWHDGPPAILKGYFDRVFLRGVVFEIVDGVFYPRLTHIRRLSAVTLYGADRARTARVGDLPRRFVRHNLKPLVAPDAAYDYLAAYGMDHADSAAREKMIARVRQAFGPARRR